MQRLLDIQFGFSFLLYYQFTVLAIKTTHLKMIKHKVNTDTKFENISV